MPVPFLRRGASGLALAALSACASPSSARSTLSAPAPEPAPARRIVVTQGATPAFAGDFPDPFILVTDSAYYAYATNVGTANVPMLRSADLVGWTPLGDALPQLPPWAVRGRSLTWAPAVAAIDGRYVLFYTARDRQSGLQCIGRAESASPAGPFEDGSAVPFLCQADMGGSIDPSVVRDGDGRLYLLWKNDGNCCGQPVTLWSQRLRADGRALAGPRAPLLARDQIWEGPLIEGPTMWEEHGTWHLLYAAHEWDTARYATGAAECASPLGPCRKTGDGPVLTSDSVTAGPGGAEAFTDREGRRWIAYHGWGPAAVGYRGGGARSLWLGRVELVPPPEPQMAVGQGPDTPIGQAPPIAAAPGG